MSTSRRPVQLRRGGSAVAIALLVLAQLGALSHAAVVQHVRCATHGELIEAAEVDTHSTGDVRLVGARPGAGSDEHCELAAALHHATTATASAPSITQQPQVATIAPAPLDTFARAAIYRFAPKTSPPDRWVSST